MIYWLPFPSPPPRPNILKIYQGRQLQWLKKAANSPKKSLAERSASQPNSEHGTGTAYRIRGVSGGPDSPKPFNDCYRRKIFFLRLEMHPWVWRGKYKKRRKKTKRAQDSKGKFKGLGFFAAGVQKRGVCVSMCVSVLLSSFLQLCFPYWSLL